MRKMLLNKLIPSFLIIARRMTKNLSRTRKQERRLKIMKHASPCWWITIRRKNILTLCCERESMKTFPGRPRGRERLRLNKIWSPLDISAFSIADWQLYTHRRHKMEIEMLSQFSRHRKNSLALICIWREMLLGAFNSVYRLHELMPMKFHVYTIEESFAGNFSHQ